jgi:hypothetical protein
VAVAKVWGRGMKFEKLGQKPEIENKIAPSMIILFLCETSIKYEGR